MKKSFTLIELLVVATIMVLLTSVATAAYSQFSKQSRDAKRKADLEQVRGALEMYRSNNTGYPAVASYGALSNYLTSSPIYIQSMPADPRPSSYSYFYSGSATNYTIAAYLEGGGTVCQAGCGGSCNYCLGPYGQQ